MGKCLSGSIIYIDLGKSNEGHEENKSRPALVISGDKFNKYCNMTFIVPISHANNYPLHIDLPNGIKTTGKVLCEHIRSVDLNAREWKLVETLNTEKGIQFVNKIKNICCNCILE